MVQKKLLLYILSKLEWIVILIASMTGFVLASTPDTVYITTSGSTLTITQAGTVLTLGKYYRVATSGGERTIKAMQPIIEGVYGICSASNYEFEDDVQGMVIPEGSPEATQEQIDAFNLWYNG